MNLSQNTVRTMQLLNTVITRMAGILVTKILVRRYNNSEIANLQTKFEVRLSAKLVAAVN